MPTTDQKTSIMDLPTELLGKIGTMTDSKDLFTIRLVCKKAKDDIARRFAETYFNTITVLLCDKESLQHGIQIASHPAFGRAVQTINIYVDELPRSEKIGKVVEEVHKSRKAFAHDDNRVETFFELAKVHKRMEAAAGMMRVDDAYLQHLLLMMCHLKTHGRVEKLVISDDIISDQAFAPMRALRKYAIFGFAKSFSFESVSPDDSWSIGFRLKPPSPHEYLYLEIILEALSLSGLDLSTLTMRAYFEENFEDLHSCVLPIHLLARDERLLLSFESVIAGLHSLKLSAWAEQNATATPTNFARVFDHATKLKTLDLEILNSKCVREEISSYVPLLDDYDLDTSNFPRILLQHAAMPSLEGLRITGGTIDFADISTFVKRHGSLQEVHATSCDLRGIEMYESILKNGYDSFGGETWKPEDFERAKEFDEKLTEMLGVKFEYIGIPDSEARW